MKTKTRKPETPNTSDSAKLSNTVFPSVEGLKDLEVYISEIIKRSAELELKIAQLENFNKMIINDYHALKNEKKRLYDEMVLIKRENTNLKQKIRKMQK